MIFFLHLDLVAGDFVQITIINFFFFFDCCLDNKPGLFVHGAAALKKKDYNLKRAPACLVAFAMIIKHTIDDVVKAQEKSTEKDQVTYQRPHYKSDVGIV